MKIWKLSSGSYENSWSGWILPNGEIVKVDDIRHAQYVKFNYRKFGITFEEISQVGTDYAIEYYKLAYRKQAVRYASRGHYVAVEGSRWAIRHFADKIYGLCKNFGVNDLVYRLLGSDVEEQITPSEIYNV